MRIFADDILLYRIIREISDFLVLLADVDLLTSWLSENDLTLSVAKCKSLWISRKPVPSVSHPVLVYGTALEKVLSYKYLGVTLSSDLSWSSHVSCVCLRAKKILGMFYRHFYHVFDAASLQLLYISLVWPLFEYAVPVWDPHLSHDISSLESVQCFASKTCTKHWRDVNTLSICQSWIYPNLPAGDASLASFKRACWNYL